VNSSRRLSGLTLIELLVAVAIFGLLSVLGYGGLNRLLDSRERLAQEQRYWRELSVVFLRLGDDLAHARARQVRDEAGFSLPAFRGQPVDPRALGAPSLELTRGGEFDYQGARRSDLRRVAWRLREGALERLTWPALDRAPTSKPIETVMMRGVELFELRFIGDTDDPERWPSSGHEHTLPRAVEVTVSIEGRARYARVFLVNG
jgi:general secretion pathway protein J